MASIEFSRLSARETFFPGKKTLLPGKRLACAVMFVLLAGFCVPAPAQAQGVLALVNNRPITSFDVEQRIRIAALTERRRLDRKSALRELVDDQVKLIEARRVGYRVTDEGVETEYVKLAKGNRQTEREFSDALQKAGLQPSALRDKIRADLAWTVLLRDQSRRGSQVTNSELETALEEKRRKTGMITEYTLQQIVFIVPPGSNPAERERAASAARAKFTSCETGIDELRQMKDVAVRGTVVRSSEDIAPQLKQLLDKTPVGRLSPSSRTSQGVELVAVCDKRERESASASRSNVAVDLSEKKITENSKGYLEEIRKKVEITYR